MNELRGYAMEMVLGFLIALVIVLSSVSSVVDIPFVYQGY